jgi:hypothetical protein
MRTRRAIESCGRWLAFCRSDGWPAESLDQLETIWWQYHDDNGVLKEPTPRACMPGGSPE